jgi:CubicO group peptidase (beta-lactamase class C family)
MTAYFGVADVTTGDPITAKTCFSIGSLTKSMVATVIARLAEANRLSLDDPLRQHVRELRRARWAEGATLRDLLANRSGLPLSAGLEFDFASRSDGDDGALSRLVADIPVDQPGTTLWSYTNVGWCVLGRVIETTAGVTWEDAMQRHLFDKAGMRDTVFAYDNSIRKPRARGHVIKTNGPVPVAPIVTRAYGPAGTSVLSTVTDLLRFAALHLDDPSLVALRRVHAEVPIYAWLDSWCLGWAWFNWPGGQVWGWDGLISGERSVCRIVPEHRAAVVLMTNSSTGRAMYRSLFADLMDSLFGISVPPLRLECSIEDADLSRFAGLYGWPDQQITVEATERRLLIKSEHNEAEALPLDERTFLVDPLDPENPTVTFGTFDPRGRPQVIYRMLWGLPRLDDG